MGVGEQIVEAAAEAKADVVAVVEAVQEKIAEVAPGEEVAETVTEIKEAIAKLRRSASRSLRQRQKRRRILNRSLRSRANLPWNAGRSLVVVEGFFHSKRATDICRSLHEHCRAEDSLRGSMWRTPRPCMLIFKTGQVNRT